MTAREWIVALSEDRRYSVPASLYESDIAAIQADARAELHALKAKVERYENELRDMRQAVDELWNSISTEGSTIEGYIVNVAKLTAVRQLALATQALEEPK